MWGIQASEDLPWDVDNVVVKAIARQVVNPIRLQTPNWAHCHGNIWSLSLVQLKLQMHALQAALQILNKECGGSDSVDLTLGAITVASGVVGTLGGGMLLDRIGSDLRNCMLLQVRYNMHIFVLTSWCITLKLADCSQHLFVIGCTQLGA